MGTPLSVTIAVMTVIVAIAMGLFAYGRSPRTLFVGIGFTLLSLRLFLMGMSDLLVSGVKSLIAWVGRTGWTSTMNWGVDIGGLGVLLIAIAHFPPGVKPRQDQEDGTPRERPAIRKSKAKPAATKEGQQAVQVAHSTPGPGGAASQKDADGDENLDKIKAALERRGVV